jgi:hypothetical protein
MRILEFLEIVQVFSVRNMNTRTLKTYNTLNHCFCPTVRTRTPVHSYTFVHTEHKLFRCSGVRNPNRWTLKTYNISIHTSMGGRCIGLAVRRYLGLAGYLYRLRLWYHFRFRRWLRRLVGWLYWFLRALWNFRYLFRHCHNITQLVLWLLPKVTLYNLPDFLKRCCKKTQIVQVFRCSKLEQVNSRTARTHKLPSWF